LEKEQIKNKKEIVQLIQIFIIHRPDIGYISGISHILIQLLTIFDEYNAFLCMMNLLHQEYFIPFYRSDMREVILSK